MIRRTSVVIIAVLAAVSIFAAVFILRSKPDWNAPQGQIVEEDREIWRVILKKEFSDPKVLMVYAEPMIDVGMISSASDHPQTYPEALKGFVRDRLQKVEPKTTNNFLYRNKQPAKLSGIILPSQQVIVPKEKLDAIFSPPNSSPWQAWSRFYESFPNSSGLITLTLPGYDSEGRSAIVYIANVRGGRAAHGTYYSLRKRHGAWEITGEATAWMS